MGIMIDVQVPMPAGENEAIISSVNTVDGKWGPRLHIVFQDEEERTASGFFPMKANESNNLGKLLKAVFGKIQKIESDELLEQRVKVLVEHHEKTTKPTQMLQISYKDVNKERVRKPDSLLFVFCK